jgi:crotonobetainyl-CoA:carnitine CoA-transferase CaiB-like acyl-CoA transferase
MTNKAFAELMDLRGLPAPAAGEVTITGADPFFKTPHKIGGTVAAVLAAGGVAASDLWELRTGRRQKVEVNVAEAAATLHISEYTRSRGADGTFGPAPHSPSMDLMRSITQPWPTADGRYFLPHFNLPHLQKRVLGALNCEPNPASVSAAVKSRTADDLEDAVAAARGCGGKVRTQEEWRAHPHGAWLATRPVVEVTKIADSAPEPLPPGDRPLSGIRVLDLTRILAGPTAGRTLGEHGADVLMVAHPDLPQVPEYVRDLSHGKRSSFLDLNDPKQLDHFRGLAAGADIFLNGYRPGRLAAKGFSVEELAKLRPGIINVSVSCFGPGGPFSDRAGWEQVAQSVSGLAVIHGNAIGAGQPKLAPAPMCDYVTGYIAAYGAMLALGRRAREGGSYNVSVSLCQSAMFYLRQGQIEDFANAPGKLTEDHLQRLYVREDGTAYGDLLTLGPALRMSETPCRWALPTPKFGGHAPEWVSRLAAAA